MAQMGAATGVQVHTRDLHQPDVAGVALWKPAGAHGFLSIGFRTHPAGGHLPPGADLSGHGLFQAFHVAQRNRGGGEFDVTDRRPQVEGRGLPLELILRHGREQVLARVLLHVIEAAGPVQAQRGGAFGHGPTEVVPDLALPLLDLHHGHAIQGAQIAGLASAFGVEEGVLQDGEGPSLLLTDLQDAGLQRGGERVAFIGGQLGHAGSLAQPG